MKLDKTLYLPEGVQASLSYEGTAIYRIDFRSGRGAIETELESKEEGLLDVIEEIVGKHPGEAILFFIHKVRDDIDCRGIIEQFLTDKGYDLTEASEDKLRFNWLTHGNYTASNSYSHCTVMIFVGMLHKPLEVYRAQTIAQTRDLTKTITRIDERRIKQATLATDAHQGINRGASRIIRGDVTQPVTAYYTYPSDALVEGLKTVMPGIEHRVYDTDKLKPRTLLEKAYRALRRYLQSLPNMDMLVSKAKANKDVTELAQANRRLRDRVSSRINADSTVPWKTRGRSWVRVDC
jgi:hypothetical protein